LYFIAFGQGRHRSYRVARNTTRPFLRLEILQPAGSFNFSSQSHSLWFEGSAFICDREEEGGGGIETPSADARSDEEEEKRTLLSLCAAG